MMERFLPKPKVLEPEICHYCGEQTTSQIYTLELDRPSVERTWFFCSLSHLRKWATEKPKTCTIAMIHTKHNGDATKDCRMPAEAQNPVVRRLA